MKKQQQRSGGRGRGKKPAPKPVPVDSKLDLDGFVMQLRARINNPKYVPLTREIADTIVDYIIEVMKPLDIRVNHDNFSSIERYDAYRHAFVTKQPGCVFEGITDEKQIIRHFRFLLSSNRHKANYNTPMVYQSNGIVISVFENGHRLDCEVLAVPPHDFAPSPNQEILEKNIKAYDIYEVNDGTSINLYYDRMTITHIQKQENVQVATGKLELVTTHVYKLGGWMKGTKNAFDTSELSWRGYSYNVIVDDVMKNYPEFDYNKLDKSLVYTIGIKHPAYHPFGQLKEWKKDDSTPIATSAATVTASPSTSWIRKAWLIQATDKSKIVPVKIGIDYQVTVNESVTNMFALAKRSLELYNETGKVHLGFILRHRARTQADEIIESELWSAIRQMIYQLPFIPDRIIREKQEQNFKNMRFVILDNYLDIARRGMFIKLFPQFKEAHAFYDKFITDLAKRVRGVLAGASYPADSDPIKEQQLQVLIPRFTNIVRDQYQLIVNTPKNKQPNYDIEAIKTLLIAPRHVDVYFQTFNI